MNKVKKTSVYLIVFFVILSLSDKVLSRYEQEVGNFFVNVINFIRTKKWQSFYLDQKGIPVQFTPRIGRYTSPFYVVQACILYLHRNVNGCFTEIGNILEGWPQETPNSFTKSHFQNCLNYVFSSIKTVPGVGKHVVYDFDWYTCKSPWYSGLTDAMAIFLFAQMFQITKDLRYSRMAQELYESLRADNSNVLKKASNNIEYIEEYVSVDSHSVFVFNGAVISAICIDYYERMFSVCNPIGNRLISSLKKCCKWFDSGYWTWYDTSNTLASVKYHIVNKKCVKGLFNITQDLFFKDVFEKWDCYKTSFLKRHFYWFWDTGIWGSRLSKFLSVILFLNCFFLTTMVLFLFKVFFKKKE